MLTTIFNKGSPSLLGTVTEFDHASGGRSGHGSTSHGEVGGESDSGIMIRGNNLDGLDSLEQVSTVHLAHLSF